MEVNPWLAFCRSRISERGLGTACVPHSRPPRTNSACFYPLNIPQILSNPSNHSHPPPPHHLDIHRTPTSQVVSGAGRDGDPRRQAAKSHAAGHCDGGIDGGYRAGLSSPCGPFNSGTYCCECASWTLTQPCPLPRLNGLTTRPPFDSTPALGPDLMEARERDGTDAAWPSHVHAGAGCPASPARPPAPKRG